MRKKSIYISVGFHVAVVILATASVPWLKKDFVIPQPISVEFAEVSKITQTDKIAPQPEEKKKEEKKEEPPKPAPAAKNTAAEAQVPVKTEEKKEEPPKKEEKKELVDKNALPDKKKKDEKKKKETTEKEEPKRDFASVLKNLEDKPDAKSKSKLPDLNLDDKAAPSAGQNAPIGPKMTMSEEDALRRQLEKCWNVPFGAKDAENLVVEIFMVINPDRTLQSARVVDTARYNTDSFFRAAADSALRAVRSPLCSPFEVPPDKYEVWKATTVTFNPSEMF